MLIETFMYLVKLIFKFINFCLLGFLRIINFILYVLFVDCIRYIYCCVLLYIFYLFATVIIAWYFGYVRDCGDGMIWKTYHCVNISTLFEEATGG